MKEVVRLTLAVLGATLVSVGLNLPAALFAMTQEEKPLSNACMREDIV